MRGGNVAQGAEDALEDDGEQAHQQQRREDLAYDVHHGGLLEAQGQDHRKEQNGEQYRRHAGQVRRNGHLKGAGGGTGNGYHGADAQDDGAHEDLGRDAAGPVKHSLAAAHPQQGKHTQQRQADIGHIVSGEAGQPLLAELHAQIGREYHVARAEKHGKQREAYHDHIAEEVAFLLCTLTLLLKFQKYACHECYK